MKLGPAGQNYSEAVKKWARVAPITKLIDDPGIFRDTPDSAIKVFRAYTGDWNKDTAAVFKAIVDRLKGYRHDRLYVEIINEPIQWDEEVIAFARAITALLHSQGIKVAGPCWSTGTPEEIVWLRWRDEGWAGMDAVAVHTYWGNEGFTPWHALRPYRFWQPGDPPLLITECGRDRVEGGQGGWKRDGVSAEQYVNELLAFDAILESHAYVLGATPFTGGPGPDWANFDTDPLVDMILARQDSPPPLPPPPGPTPVPQPAPGSGAGEIAAIEARYNIAHRDSPTIVLAELIERPDPPAIAADGPADAEILISTNDNAHQARGRGHVEMAFTRPAAYYPTEGQRGPFYAECEGARVDGLGWAYGLPGDTAPHRNVAVRFARRLGQAQPTPTPAPPPQPQPEPTPQPTPGANMLRLLDIASYQGIPDFAQVAAANIAGIILKCTEGTGYVNPTFKPNWPAIKAAGLWRASYHYARPDGNEPEAEADYFLAAVGPLEDGDALVLDIEAGTGNLADWVLRWLRRVEERAGVTPILYSGEWFMRPHGLVGVPELARYPLWIANYPAGPPNVWPAPPPPWGEVTLWQFTDKAQVSGVVGPVDMNLYRGTVDGLRALGKAQGAQPAPSDPNRAPLDVLYAAIMAARDAYQQPEDLECADIMVGLVDRIKWRHNIP